MNKQQPILVTGGTGFVGSYIVRKMVRLGYTQVQVLHRDGSDRSLLHDVADRVHWVDGNIVDVVGIYDLVSKVQVVIHAAAMVSFLPRDRDKLMKTNMEGTANIVNAAIEHQIDRLIYISSIATLGRKPGKAINEMTEWSSEDNPSPYAESKYHAEMEVWRGAAEGLPVAILNPSLVIGSGFWQKGSASMVRQIQIGLRFYPTGGTGFVDVRDVADATIRILEGDYLGKRYLLSGENQSFQWLFREIARHLDVKAPSISLSPWLREIAFWGSKLVAGLSADAKVISRATLKNASEQLLFDASKSVEELGMQYRPLEETVKDTCLQLKEAMVTGEIASRLPVE